MSKFIYTGMQHHRDAQKKTGITLKLPASPDLNNGSPFKVYQGIELNKTVIEITDPVTLKHIEERCKDLYGNATFQEVP